MTANAMSSHGNAGWALAFALGFAACAARTVGDPKPDPSTLSTAGSPRRLEIETSIGLSLLPVPAGKFRMGTPGHPTLESPHEVVITRPFWIAETEVTQRQWRELMHTEPWSDGPVVGDDRPAVKVTWVDARKFCERLDEHERFHGNIPAGYRIALPTEAEWERACRAGSDGAYCFGDRLDQLSDYAVWRGNSAGYAHPVATRLPNAFGLFDMHGNVWEWCADAFVDVLGDATDPIGTTAGAQVLRSRRGGSADCEAGLCRSAVRECNTATYSYVYVGFRPALVLR